MSDLIATYGLTPRQNAVLCEFMRNGFNKKKAADTVGCGSSVFNDPKMIMAINDLSREALADTQFQAVGLIGHLADISFANVADYFDWKNGKPSPKADLTKEQLACVSELKQDKDGIVTVKLHDKFQAIDRLAKLMRWYESEAASIQVTVNEAAPVEEIDASKMAREIAFMLRDAAEKKKHITDIEVDNGDGSICRATYEEHRVQDDSLGDINDD